MSDTYNVSGCLDFPKSIVCHVERRLFISTDLNLQELATIVRVFCKKADLNQFLLGKNVSDIDSYCVLIYGPMLNNQRNITDFVISKDSHPSLDFDDSGFVLPFMNLNGPVFDIQDYDDTDNFDIGSLYNCSSDFLAYLEACDAYYSQGDYLHK